MINKLNFDLSQCIINVQMYTLCYNKNSDTKKKPFLKLKMQQTQKCLSCVYKISKLSVGYPTRDVNEHFSFDSINIRVVQFSTKT